MNSIWFDWTSNKWVFLIQKVFKDIFQKFCLQLQGSDVIDVTHNRNQMHILLLVFSISEQLDKIQLCVWHDLQMLWMMTNAIDQLVWLQFANANAIDGGEQRESGNGSKENKRESNFWTLLNCDYIYLSSIPLFLSIKLTSSAVIGPCNFCPFNISASNSTIDLPLLTKASDTLRLRPPA